MPSATRSLAVLTLTGVAVAGVAMIGSPRRPAAIAPEPTASTVAAPAPSPLPAAARAAEVSPCRAPGHESWLTGLGELRASAITADRDGNTYLAARTRSPDRAYVTAHGPAGGQVWRAEIGEGVTAGIAVDRGGDLIVIGSLAPRSEGGDATQRRAFVARVGRGGGLRWRREIGEPGDEGRAIAADASGNLVALVEGPQTLKILALDAGAGVRWARALGDGKAEIRAGSIAIGPDGGVVVGGAYKGRVDLGGGALPAPKYDARGFLLALDAAGAHRFSVPVGAPSESIQPALAAVDGAGRIVVTAVEDGQSNGVIGFADVTVIAGFDDRGKQRFEHRLRHDARATGLAIDAAGNAVVAGHFAGALELGGRVRLPPRPGDGGGGFVLSLDASGALRFAAPVPPANPMVAVLPTGDVVMASDPYADTADRLVTAFCPPSTPPGPGDAPQPRVHAVRKRFALPGGEGHVELLLDARMKPGAEKEFGCFFWARGAGPGFDSPPLGAALRLVDTAGKVIDQVDDAHPMATAEPNRLYGDDRVTFAFTVNDSPCMGKRRGHITSFYEPASGKLRELRDQGGVPISFTTAMTGAARVVPAREGPGKDILVVRSHDSDGPGSKDGYVTLLARYSFTGGRWVSHQKRVPGEWYDGAFPARSDFP